MIRFAAFLFATTIAVAATTYSYDSAGRLIKADYGGGASIAYTYDNAGNLLSRVVTSASTSSSTTAKKTSKNKKTHVDDEKKPDAKPR